jgi:hypothetical protein
VCFSHPDLQRGALTTGQILETIYNRGRVWISDVLLGGQERVLRACITSFQSTEEDIECLIEEIEHARPDLLRPAFHAQQARHRAIAAAAGCGTAMTGLPNKLL